MGSRPKSFSTPPAPPAMVWHKQQQDIFAWFRRDEGASGDQSPHLIVQACAGTGKTTTLIEGVNRAPEKYVLICAYTKQIAEELTRRVVKAGVEAKTMHSLGYWLVRRAWRGIGVERTRNARSLWLTDKVVDKDCPFGMRKLISELHTTGRDLIPADYSIEKLIMLAKEYDLEPDAQWQEQGWTTEMVAHYAFDAIVYASTNEPDYATGIDFADMMFLPFAWNLLEKLYDLVVVDEMQDFSKAQLLMALAVCRGRIAGFGDRRQAIFAFRGADTRSMDRIKEQLGAMELPLTVTYRCAKAIVEHAQRIVPVIEAAPSNPRGAVLPMPYGNMVHEAKAGDFILSRLNAPLVRITLKLLMMRKKARMRGRQIGQGLVTLVYRLVGRNQRMTMDQFLTALNTWERKQVTYMLSHGDPEGAAQAKDKAAMLAAFAEESANRSVQSLIGDITNLFVDTTDADTIICSSIHKAKGLEAHTVYLLQESLYRRGWNEDEENCEYVGITRAKERLLIVSGMPGV